MTGPAGAGHLSTTGGRVEYHWVPPRRAVSGKRATLVLLHEGLGCVALWRDFPGQLAEATGLGVFAYSRIGYGRSDPCDLPRPLDYMQREGRSVLPQVLSQIETDDIILVGHSDGASIAAIHAGSEPDPRLRGVVLLAPHFFTEQVSIDAIAEARTAFESGSLREALSRYHGDNVDCAFRGWNDAWLDPRFRQWDLRGFLPEIRVPVLFIQGQQDQYGSLAQLDALEERLRAPLRSLVLDGCRHSPQFDQADKTRDAIVRFVGDITTRQYFKRITPG